MIYWWNYINYYKFSFSPYLYWIDICVLKTQTTDYLDRLVVRPIQIQMMHVMVCRRQCHGVPYYRPAWNAHYHRIRPMWRQPMAHGKLSTALVSNFSYFRPIMIDVVAVWYELLVQQRHVARRRFGAVSGIRTAMQRIKNIDPHRWWHVSRYVEIFLYAKFIYCMPSSSNGWVHDCTRCTYSIFGNYAKPISCECAASRMNIMKFVLKFDYVMERNKFSQTFTSSHPTILDLSRIAQIIRENWNLKYSACFVLCPVTAPGLAVPYSVSVVSKIRTPPGNIVLIRNTDEDADLINTTHINNIPDKIGVCVKPLHFDYDSVCTYYSSIRVRPPHEKKNEGNVRRTCTCWICDLIFHFEFYQALHLLEFLEMNTLLGVSHFTFYNHTLGPRASCVLRHYMNSDLNTSAGAGNSTRYASTTISHSKASVSMLPWDLRMRSQKDIRTEGLFAALNDCLYRSMYRYVSRPMTAIA